ncbi:MAG: hypothetical protein HFK04_01845 [Oscillospiraceae bacterium]|nr:hypothetical protein [Oscillospiraceae bacterium]
MNENEGVVQNLKDAGCDGETIHAFVEKLRAGKIEDGLRLLAKHRRTLLDNLHKKQQQIDGLDYLIHTMQKKHQAKGACDNANN